MAGNGKAFSKAISQNSVTRQHRGLIQNALGSAISVVVLCVALWFLHHELSSLRPGSVIQEIRSIPFPVMLAAIGFAVCSYLILTGYDAVGMRYIGRKLPYRKTAVTAFMAFAVGHNVGFAALSGGSIRYRMYSSLGLSASEIARVIVFVSVTFAAGASLLLGLAMLLMSAAETSILKLPTSPLHAAGLLLVVAPPIYILGGVLRSTPISLGSWQISLPRPAISFAQIGLGIADLTFAAATLYVLLAPELSLAFLPFLGIYLIALAAGLISNVPGGIGVFEAVLLIALPDTDRSMLLGVVIVYRLIYYVAPLIVAMLLLVGHEVKEHRHILQKSTEKAGEWLSAIAPQIVAIAVFLAGVVLLISGSTPAVETRLNFVARGMPLPILELSHLAGSILGVCLLVLARGLHRRLQTAYIAAFGLLGSGVVISILKGFDYEEALILFAILILLWSCRAEFYRRGSLASQRFTPSWIVSILLVLCIALWIGLISFRHIEYSHELWWQFALHADAPRMLRASLAAGVTALSIALWKLMRSGTASPVDGDTTDFELIARIIRTYSNSFANAALLDDKRFLWSKDRQAFIMYQVSGNSWIALGDPVGPTSAREELAWAFREAVDQHDGRPVFYQISDESLALYVDMGLTLAKIGEDARVSLKDFSLQGGHRSDFRQAINRAKKQGASFEVVSSEGVKALVAELREVSDSWLEDKSAAEKGFSLGSFSEAYISNFDCAVVRVGNEIVAFANLWAAPVAGELSIDLMRYDHRAPKGVMDYLFAELMLWGKAQQYAWFSLGMAPLSGLEKRPLAPLWHKIGHLIFSHGESFYNFEGLRNYKEKFNPEWRPRYIACPGGLLGLPRALLDTSRLISGGVTKVMTR